MKAVSFRIRRPYFDAIVAGTKDREVRRASQHWRAVAAILRSELGEGSVVTAVFVCGRDVHRRHLRAVREFATPEEALGRPPSEQGRADLGAGPVFAFFLGEPVVEGP